MRAWLVLEPIEKIKAGLRQAQAGKTYGENHPKEELRENFPQALETEHT